MRDVKDLTWQEFAILLRGEMEYWRAKRRHLEGEGDYGLAGIVSTKLMWMAALIEKLEQS